MRILVTGGAGYIGSHMVKMLHARGMEVIVLDDLSTGHRDAAIYGDFIEGDCGNPEVLDKLFIHTFDAVMHFASFTQVSESVRDPQKYYKNNLLNTINLLNAMRINNIKNFIFSSTAATYGEPQQTLIDELHPQNPINPYGRTKLMVERLLADYEHAYGIKSVCLRYFNAAGADPSGELGERHEPETHLIPLVLQVASGRRDHISLFGRDYDTPDGTCIRDYIHIQDLCEAHWLALIYLKKYGKSCTFNLGNGNGFSVQEVIDTAARITGRNISVIETARREGDPVRLVANAELARVVLGWRPKYSDLSTIIDHAWRWEKKYSR